MVERQNASLIGREGIIVLETVDVVALPLAPRNPLPYLRQMTAARAFHTGCETLRDAGGPVTRRNLAPKWMLPPLVTSPNGARDVLSRGFPSIDRVGPLSVSTEDFSAGHCSTTNTARGYRADVRFNLCSRNNR